MIDIDIIKNTKCIFFICNILKNTAKNDFIVFFLPQWNHDFVIV